MGCTSKPELLYVHQSDNHVLPAFGSRCCKTYALAWVGYSKPTSLHVVDSDIPSPGILPILVAGHGKLKF
jgi:hypothetical protein